MTPQEAIEIIRRAAMRIELDYSIDSVAFDMAVKALERDIPMAPGINGDQSGAWCITWWYICPICHRAVNKKNNYCRDCGRRLAWDD